MAKRKNPYSARGKPIGVIGDMSPIEHGGGIVFRRPGGQYSLLYFQAYNGDELVSVYDIEIDDDVLSDLDWASWEAIAKFIDMPVSELKGHARSDNVMARASVYEAIGSYQGFGNLDPNQQEMKLSTAEGKWGRSVDAAHRAQSKARTRNPMGKRRAQSPGSITAVARKAPRKPKRKGARSPVERNFFNFDVPSSKLGR